jgi:signal transduction histidine kinase
MFSQLKQWPFSRFSTRGILDRTKSLMQQWSSQESAEYQVRQRQFMLDRLHLVTWLGIARGLPVTVFLVWHLLAPIPSLQAMSQENQVLGFWLGGLTEGLWIFALFLRRTVFIRQHPAILFLYLSLSLTVLPQVAANCIGVTSHARFNLNPVFFSQAALVPVRWRLHLLSQILPLLYFVVVNPLLGLTTSNEGRSIYSPALFWYIGWYCFLGDLAVYLYERLQRSEFAARRELQAVIHSISHDLKTPVTGTAIVLNSLLSQPDTEIKVKRSTLERLRQGGDRQINLINSLSEAHEHNIQGIVLHRQPLQLSNVVEAVLMDLAPVLEKNRCR